MAKKNSDKVALKDNDIPLSDDTTNIIPDIYNEIAKKANLIAIQLISSRFQITPAYFGNKDGLNLKIDFEEIDCSFDPESCVATGIFSFEVKALRNRHKVFSLKDEFVVAYEMIDSCDELHGKAFASRVGIIACYPYFRSHAAATASLANAELPVLPIVTRPPVTKRQQAAT